MSTVIGHCVHEKKIEQPPKSRTVVLRERETETETDRDRQTERERQREREREREREKASLVIPPRSHRLPTAFHRDRGEMTIVVGDIGS